MKKTKDTHADKRGFHIAIFGGLGDLAQEKLLPALYNLSRLEGELLKKCKIILIDKKPKAGWTQEVTSTCRRALRKEYNETEWNQFISSIKYLRLNISSKKDINKLRGPFMKHPEWVRIFYMAIAPELMLTAISRIKKQNLRNSKSRIVVEKPIGHDRYSAKLINNAISQVFTENEIFRIDHYLGKEAIQNLLMLRFANRLLEPLWSRDHIEHVQITVSESKGIGTRGHFYDNVGALRDMVQNHLLQILCLIAMDPPARLDAVSVHNSKAEILRALRPFSNTEEHRQSDQYKNVVRGQYIGYKEDLLKTKGFKRAVAQNTKTETFVAIKAHVDNWRWFDVPFFLRTGKKMRAQYAEIVVQFRRVPHQLFPLTAEAIDDRLVILLQPDMGIELWLMHRVPGLGQMRLKPASLRLFPRDDFKRRIPDAYERLLLDVINGNQMLFVHRDEIDLAWAWVDEIRGVWEDFRVELHDYLPMNDGPDRAIGFIERGSQAQSYERSWHIPTLIDKDGRAVAWKKASSAQRSDSES